MRDLGFDFWWKDKYCENLFAQGLEIADEDSSRFELLTAFEVLEHLVDPLGGVEEMLALSDTLLFSTELLPANPPALDQWFYYGLDHGQHVAFYSGSALQELAKHFNLHLLSYGTYMHMLSRKKMSELRWRCALNRFSKFAINLLYQRESLLWPDHDRVLKSMRETHECRTS